MTFVKITKVLLLVFLLVLPSVVHADNNETHIPEPPLHVPDDPATSLFYAIDEDVHEFRVSIPPDTKVYQDPVSDDPADSLFYITLDDESYLLENSTVTIDDLVVKNLHITISLIFQPEEATSPPGEATPPPGKTTITNNTEERSQSMSIVAVIIVSLALISLSNDHLRKDQFTGKSRTNFYFVKHVLYVAAVCILIFKTALFFYDDIKLSAVFMLVVFATAGAAGLTFACAYFAEARTRKDGELSDDNRVSK